MRGRGRPRRQLHCVQRDPGRSLPGAAGGDHDLQAELLADIALVSEIILAQGEKYAPLLDQLEYELNKRRQADRLAVHDGT